MIEERFPSGADGSAAASIPAAQPAECPLSPRWKRISKRVAQVGFLFFLLKGLAWIAVGLIAWKGVS